MKDELESFLGAIVAFLIMLNALLGLIFIPLGIQDSGIPSRRCEQPPLRVEFVFPIYRLGCFLGAPAGGWKPAE